MKPRIKLVNGLWRAILPAGQGSLQRLQAVRYCISRNVKEDRYPMFVIHTGL